MKNPRRLVCACCGAETRGRQWWNRDTGYGVCPACYATEAARCGTEYAVQCYGQPGVHHSLPDGERSESRPITAEDFELTITDTALAAKPAVQEWLAECKARLIFADVTITANTRRD